MPSLERPLIGDFKEYTRCTECKQVYPKWRATVKDICTQCGSRSMETVIAREINVRKHLGLLVWGNVFSHYEVRP